VNTKIHSKTSGQGGQWHLKIGSQIHGPYRVAQMRSLVMQGMLTPHSQISLAGTDEWRTASDEPAMAVFFRGTKSKFAQRTAAPASTEKSAKIKSTNFLLIIDIKAESNNDLEQAIRRMGQVTNIMKNIWILHGSYTVGTVRNALIQYMRPMDSLFIIDVGEGKNASFNLGPKVDAKLRTIWKDNA
jgi:GYF domain 2